MAKDPILVQEHIITNPFNEKMMIAAFHAELSSAIFKELIQSEKDGLKVTLTIEDVIDPAETDKH